MAKRASYRHGVSWIALNDEPVEMDPQEIASLISVLLLADLFEVEPLKVAQDIVKIRIREFQEDQK